MSYQSRMAIIADLVAEVDYRPLLEPPAFVRAVGEMLKPNDYDKYRITLERSAERLRKTLAVRDEARQIVWQGYDREFSEKDFSDLDEWIEKLDRSIDYNTKDYINTARFLKRELRSMKGQLSKDKYHDVADVFTRGQSIWSQEIAETIEFATFLRAVRASKAQPSSISRIFDNPSDLTRYLQGVTGGVE